MTTSKFNYQLYPLGETEKYRPMIKTRIGYNGALSGFQAIVDSGSDWTISFVEIGEALGINFDSDLLKEEMESRGLKFKDKVEGITGNCEVYTVPANLAFNDKEATIVVRWLRTKFDPKKDFPLILGQDSIFSFYDIHFSRRQKKFFLNSEVLSK